MGKAVGIDEKGNFAFNECADPWYIVLTTPQGEKKAATDLRRAGMRVYLPKQSYPGSPAKAGAKPKPRYRALWTGYMLCRFTPAVIDRGRPMFALVQDCDGVRGFMRWLGASGELEPIPFSDKLVASYMRRQRSRDYDGAKLARQAAQAKRERFRPGRTVRVTEGPFASFLARIDKIKGDKAHITVEIFGRETAVVMDNFVEGLEPVDNRREAA